MFTGNMMITTDINVVKNLLGSHRVVIIGENNIPAAELTSINGIVGSILLPTYPAMMAYLDNNIQEFYRLYNDHLHSQECSSFIAVLLKAMIQNMNLLLYMTPDEYEIYFDIFSNHMRNMYGISIGNAYNNFMYDINYSYNILSLLYLEDLITVEELFRTYPTNMYFSEPVVMKLITELRPPVNFNNILDYSEYFYKYKENTRQTNNFRPNLLTKRI